MNVHILIHENELLRPVQDTNDVVIEKPISLEVAGYLWWFYLNILNSNSVVFREHIFISWIYFGNSFVKTDEILHVTRGRNRIVVKLVKSGFEREFYPVVIDLSEYAERCVLYIQLEK